MKIETSMESKKSELYHTTKWKQNLDIIVEILNNKTMNEKNEK